MVVKSALISVYVFDSSMSDLIVVGDLTLKRWHLLLLLSGHLHLHLLLWIHWHHAWLLKRHSLRCHPLSWHTHSSWLCGEATLRHDLLSEDIYVGWVLNVI